MSGLGLGDLANWALRGGAAANNNNDDDDDNSSNEDNNNDAPPPPEPALTEQEMRARRVARMEALQKQQQEQAAAAAAAAAAQEPQPMEVEQTPSPKSNDTAKATKETPTTTVTPMETESPSPLAKKAKESHNVSSSSPPKKKTAASPSSSTDPTRKLQRKKELLIKKVLNITLGPNQTDSTCIPIDIGSNNDDNIEAHSVAEILATRLALPPSALSTTLPPQKPLIQYLASAHRKASEEAKTMRQSSSASVVEKNAPLLEILQEIQNQVVSYASSSLMEPDLFEQAAGSPNQLFYAFVSQTSSAADPTSSITFGVAGMASSFYHQLCEELYSQDLDSFDRVIRSVASNLMKQMEDCTDMESTVSVSIGGIGGGAAAYYKYYHISSWISIRLAGFV